MTFTAPDVPPGQYVISATQNSADGTPIGNPANAPLEILPSPVTTTTTTTTTAPPPTTTVPTASTAPERRSTSAPVPLRGPDATTATTASAPAATTSPTRRTAATPATTRTTAPAPTAATVVAPTAARSVAAPVPAEPSASTSEVEAPPSVTPGPVGETALPSQPVTHTGEDGTAPAGVVVAGLVAVAAGGTGLTVRRRRSSTS